MKLNDRRSFIAAILPKAAKHMISKFPQKSNYAYNYTYKKGYLAEAELLVHGFITDLIHKNFPNSLVYSEEGGASFSSQQKDGSYIWILDPICGTANFIRNIPFYVHSLSVLDNAGVLVK